MEIFGIWENNTDRSIAITVNNEHYTGTIGPKGRSGFMVMNLDGLQMLQLQIFDEQSVSRPILLWLDADAELPSIRQQAMRGADWEGVPVLKITRFNNYVFNVQDDGGLLIVGTVELVESETVAAGN